MANVLFTTPTGLPCASDWDFPVEPGSFALLGEPLLQTVEGRLTDCRRAWLLLLLSGQVRRDYLASIRLGGWLRRLPGSQDAYELETRFRLLAWGLVGGLVFSRRFEFSRSPACRGDYPPGEGVVAGWEHRGGRIYRGRRFVCPKGHTLYASPTEWSAWPCRAPLTDTRR
jgi:hypothetical protein